MKINGNYGATVVNNNEKTIGSKTIKSEFSEQVGLFEDKVRNRIENGEPVYSMGRTAMTESDWENLMDNIDSYMEKAKLINEMKKEQIKEESMEKKLYDRIMLITNDK